MFLTKYEVNKLNNDKTKKLSILMKELLDIRGIITVLNTPFDNHDKIDTDSLRKNIRVALKAGVAGFFTGRCGASGCTYRL